VNEKFNGLFIYLCVCDEKSKSLTRAIRPVLSDLVSYKMKNNEKPKIGILAMFLCIQMNARSLP